jgi:D-aspartate ligase
MLFTPDVARQLLDKSGFDLLARQAGAPVPKTVVLDPSGICMELSELRVPVVVKPTARNKFYSARFAKAYKVDQVTELGTLVQKLREAGVPLVVQEWIDGRDEDIYFNFVFIDADGVLCSSFVGQKVLCWPPGVGGTVSCMAAPQHHDELTEITVQFLTKVGFRGMLGMEYKRDSRDGRFYMVEPTVYRTDHQHEIAALSGSDFLLACYSRCAGIPWRTGRPYSREAYWVEMPAARYSASLRRSGPRTELGVPRRDAYFRWSDPVPGLVHYGRGIMSRVIGGWRKLRGGKRREGAVYD